MSPLRPALIAVYDSGVGGLAIALAIRQKIPTAEVLFFCDNAGYPYGTKTEPEVIARVRACAGRLLQAVQPDLLVLACNTASTVALPTLRAEWTVPIIGVVPAIKPAAELSRTKVIGLLSTVLTAARPYTDQLIRDFAHQCRVHRHGTAELVSMAEEKLRGQPPSLQRVGTAIQPLFAAAGSELDTVVLGCTHFPFLLPELTQAAPWPVQWVDSAAAIAKRAEQLLHQRGLSMAGPPQVHHRALCSRLDEWTRALMPALTKDGYNLNEF